MAKFCPNCGNPIKGNAKFCNKCGNKLHAGDQKSNTQSFEQQTSNLNQQRNMPPPPPPQKNMNNYPNQPQTPPPQQRQQIPPPPPPAGRPNAPRQPMHSGGFPPRRSNKKLIIGIIAVVIIIAVILSLYFFVFTNDEGKFVGTWDVTKTKVSYSGAGLNQLSSGMGLNDRTDENPDFEIIFDSDGTWESDNNQSGSWKLEDRKLVMEYDNEFMSSSMDKLEFDYEFDGDDLTLTYTKSLNELYGDIPSNPYADQYDDITMTMKMYLTKK